MSVEDEIRSPEEREKLSNSINRSVEALTEAVAIASAEQVGGNHYKDCPIQPTEYIVKNGLGFCEGNIVKYITRWKLKGGKEDIEKARHYCDLLLEFIDDD